MEREYRTMVGTTFTDVTISVDSEAPEESRYSLSVGSWAAGYGVQMYREELLEIRDKITDALQEGAEMMSAKKSNDDCRTDTR